MGGMYDIDVWDEKMASGYDNDADDPSKLEKLARTLDFLQRLAEGGPALEFASGTGRVCLPLRQRGVAVHGIELSQPMTDRLRSKISAEELPVALGDMTTTLVPGQFSLVFLVYNTIGNVRTQAAQVECFRNAARHLAPGGRFLIEMGVPQVRRLPPGQDAVPFEISEQHTGFDTYDLVTQEASSHHFNRRPDGSYEYGIHHYRYVWPSELDLMAQLAGLEFEQRVAGWDGSPFTSDSAGHVSVWRKPLA